MRDKPFVFLKKCPRGVYHSMPYPDTIISLSWFKIPLNSSYMYPLLAFRACKGQIKLAHWNFNSWRHRDSGFNWVCVDIVGYGNLNDVHAQTVKFLCLMFLFLLPFLALTTIGFELVGTTNQKWLLLSYSARVCKRQTLRCFQHNLRRLWNLQDDIINKSLD